MMPLDSKFEDPEETETLSDKQHLHSLQLLQLSSGS